MEMTTDSYRRSDGLMIISGGQSGVDRAALDVAIELGLASSGWCPAGGQAEDFPQPPGLLDIYPQLTPTPSADYQQRSAWNVRDSQGTLALLLQPSDLRRSPGTTRALSFAAQLGRPSRIISLRAPGALASASDFCQQLGPAGPLNIIGPRQSEAPGIYQVAQNFLRQLLA